MNNRCTRPPATQRTTRSSDINEIAAGARNQRLGVTTIGRGRTYQAPA